ncbi:hypothetical protein [Listeria goaensis]|uniref:hypothetical protein n=1 Tax=Listeria goaensis TaxID=1649188 RepID=UPI000B59056F|nr:hypothetical protein [Listeria goaensis]
MISKSEKSQVSSLYNLYCEAYGRDVNNEIHLLKQKALQENGITKESQKLLKKMIEMRKELKQNGREVSTFDESKNTVE